MSGRGSLPCQHEPDRWFNPADRTYALSGCLTCPARRRCAAEALRHRPIAGMWAGIWIGGRFQDAAAHLRAIADRPERRDAAVPLCEGTAAPPLAAEVPADHEPTRPPQAPVHRWRTPHSVRAALAARSSGHCEVMAPGCRYNTATLVSRLRGPHGEPPDCPSLLFEACRPCAITVSCCDRVIARRGGYVIDRAADAPIVPFCWRQTRWVLLSRSGHLRDVSEAVRSA